MISDSQHFLDVWIVQPVFESLVDALILASHQKVGYDVVKLAGFDERPKFSRFGHCHAYPSQSIFFKYDGPCFGGNESATAQYPWRYQDRNDLQFAPEKIGESDENFANIERRLWTSKYSRTQLRIWARGTHFGRAANGIVPETFMVDCTKGMKAILHQ